MKYERVQDWWREIAKECPLKIMVRFNQYSHCTEKNLEKNTDLFCSIDDCPLNQGEEK
jgi:hypothetical protein